MPPRSLGWARAGAGVDGVTAVSPCWVNGGAVTGLGGVLGWGMRELRRPVSSAVALERDVKQALSRDAAVRRIVCEWRRLTGGRGVRDRDRRTLIACSGGVDSSALVLALASACKDLVVAHVVHDMREQSEALADRNAAHSLADQMGLAFAEACVTTKDAKGNPEAIARKKRYAALVQLAQELKCVAIATAHQADDQLETVLMRLMRGTGVRGMQGIAPTWTLGRVRVLRPMLGATRADAVRVCKLAGWAWQEDATNADTRMLRAMLRQEVVPAMRERSPSVSRHAVELGCMARQAAELVRDRAREILRAADGAGEAKAWDRGVLRGERAIVIGEIIRLLHTEWIGEAGRDRVRWPSVERLHAAIGDAGDHRREFRIAGVEIVVDAARVEARACGTS